MRTFIAIEIPENVKKEIVKIQEQLPEFEGKKTEIENLHLTVKFLGEVEEEKVEEMRKRLREIKFRKFNTEINFLGVFSESFVKIIWLHMKNCDELQKEIDKKLDGLFKKEKRFMGHLTIARVKNVKDKKRFLEEIKKIKIPRMNFGVNRFILKESVLAEEKPFYKDIEAYPLN